MSANSARTSLRGRVGDYLASPSVLALSVVALVTLVGSLSTFLAYRALCRQGEARAAHDLRSSAKEVRMSIELALGAADPLLDRLRTLLGDTDPAREPILFLTRMRGLSTARPALARLSVSLPDGTYLAVRRDRHGRFHAESIHRHPSGAVRDEFSFGAQGEVSLVKSEPTEYDPRTRRFYKWGLARGIRSWTTPDLFLPTFDTGVTRVEPVFRDPNDPTTLSALLTVDFDTTGLEALLGTPITRHERKLVVGAHESILAASGVKIPHASRRDSVTWADLPDRTLVAARAHTAQLPDHGSRTIEVDGENYRMSRARITELEGDPISLITLSPEAELFAEARREAQLGMLTTSLTALGGLLFALLLSENIARLRRKRAEAELGERMAREELAQLGSYELLAPIKAGGMGQVYRARHRLLARDAALKLIRTRPTDDAERAEHERLRFFAEARALASLHSVHTVAVYDFGVATDGRYFLAMELLDGFDLQELVATYGPQPAGRTANILAQICDSLSEAHASGLVHRDLKPANIFLCRQAEWLDLVKVLDFGLTRPTGVAEAHCISGTPGYMAPEQATGAVVTAQADFYGVGCVGYWLLAGEPPHRGENAEQILRSTLRDEPPRLPQPVRDGAPASLLQLITRCMAKEPAHRPVSAEHLARAFRAAAAESTDFDETKLRAFWSDKPMLHGALLDPQPFVARVPESVPRPLARAPESALRPLARAPESALRPLARSPEGALRPQPSSPLLSVTRSQAPESRQGAETNSLPRKR